MATPEITAKAVLRNFICEVCSAPMQGIRRTKRFCPTCAKEARKAVTRKYEAGRPRDRSVVKRKCCASCSTEFDTTKAWVRYCGDCRAKAEALGASGHYHLKNPTAVSIAGVTRECEYCRAIYTVKAKAQRFCSRDCNRRAVETPETKINARIRAGIYSALKGTKRGRSWTELVGYSLPDLKQHLERQFLPGMGWHNMGEWHIDHRLPLVSFNFTSPEDAAFKAAWAITNLQPMWAGENIKKKAQRLFLV